MLYFRVSWFEDVCQHRHSPRPRRQWRRKNTVFNNKVFLWPSSPWPTKKGISTKQIVSKLFTNDHKFRHHAELPVTNWYSTKNSTSKLRNRCVFVHYHYSNKNSVFFVRTSNCYNMDSYFSWYFLTKNEISPTNMLLHFELWSHDENNPCDMRSPTSMT